MRPFEWLLALLTLAASLTLFFRPRPSGPEQASSSNHGALVSRYPEAGSSPRLQPGVSSGLTSSPQNRALALGVHFYKILAPIFSALALTLFTLHALREGAHWQLYPLYLAVILTATLLFRPRSPWLALAPLSLNAASLALAWALPIFHLPAPTGPYAVGTRTLHLTDPTRNRELVIQLWYPAQPTGPFALSAESATLSRLWHSLQSGSNLARYLNPAEARPLLGYQSLVRTHSRQNAPIAVGAEAFPFILFGPMWGGARTQDTFLTEELASHGYVVAAVDHPGNAARVQLSDGHVVKSTMAHAISGRNTSAAQYQAVWNKELTVWTQDNEFVLNALDAADRTPAGWLAGRLDLQRVGALGHSFGGSASMRLLGLDPRVQSAVNMDGWTLGGLADRTTQPALFLYSAPYEPQVDVRPTGDSVDDQLSRIDRALVQASLQRFGGLKVFLVGTAHLDFTDQTLISPVRRFTYTGPLDGPRKRLITRTLVLAFFDQTLKSRNPSPTLPTFPELRWITPPR